MTSQTMNTTKEPTSRISPDETAALLGFTMRLAADHERMLACLAEKRRAIAAADVDTIARVCGDEQALIRQMRDVEKQRVLATARLTARVAPQSPQPLALREIAALASPPAAEELRERGEALRRLVGTVRRESAVVAAAAAALSRHLAGLAQTMCAAMNATGVYERRGRIAMSSAPECRIDVKS
jgi:hypothetical protein